MPPSNTCGYADCEEKPGVFKTYVACLMCGESYCPRHVTNVEYARYLFAVLPTIHPGTGGFCVDCVSRHQPQHIKGAIDRKCSRLDCLANLASMTTVKRMCSYCGRWFCTGHFFTREQLTTELLGSLRKFRVIDGEGACEDCMKRDPVGAMIVGKKGFFGGKAAEMGEKLAAVIEQRLPQIAHQTGEAAVKGAVEGIKEEKQEIVKVAQESLDAPVKQRIWGTVVALVGTLLVAILSAVLAKNAPGEIFQKYRWVSSVVFGTIFAFTAILSTIRIARAWKSVRKAGTLGQTAMEVAFKAFSRVLWMNLAALAVILVVAGGCVYWFALRR